MDYVVKCILKKTLFFLSPLYVVLRRILLKTWGLETLGVGILQPLYHLRKHILHLIIPPTYRWFLNEESLDWACKFENQTWSWVECGDTIDPSIYKSMRWNYILGRNSLNVHDYLGQQNETRSWSAKLLSWESVQKQESETPTKIVS